MMRDWTSRSNSSKFSAAVRGIGAVPTAVALMAAVVMGALAPSTASADYQTSLGRVQCPTESWDPVSRVLKFDITREMSVAKIQPTGGEDGVFNGDDGPEPYMSWAAVPGYGDLQCLHRPRPVRMEIVSEKPLDIDLTIASALIGPNGDEVKLMIDLRPSGYEPTIKLPIGSHLTAQNPRLTETGLDINGDGDEDITILAKAVKRVWMYVGGQSEQVSRVGANDDVRLLARDTRVVYREFQVHTGAGDDYVELDMPKTRVAAVGRSGNDRLVILGERDSSADGGSGNDVLDARHATGSAVLHGGPGNDRVFFGKHGGMVSGQDQSGKDVYVGGAGADSVYDFSGPDVIRLGAGNDHVRVKGSSNRARTIVDVGVGNDVVELFNDTWAKVNVGRGNDEVILFGNAWKTNFIDCGLGHDWIRAMNRSRSTSCERWSF